MQSSGLCSLDHGLCFNPYSQNDQYEIWFLRLLTSTDEVTFEMGCISRYIPISRNNRQLTAKA